MVVGSYCKLITVMFRFLHRVSLFSRFCIMFVWSLEASKIFVKTTQEYLNRHSHAHTSSNPSGGSDCTKSAGCRQILTFPKCLHSTCQLTLPQPQCQSPEFTKSDNQAGG